MIAIPPAASIYVAIQPVDFRNGISGLGKVCRNQFKKDPMDGAIFVFCNKGKKSIKLLVYDGEAFWLLTRRLSRGRLKWWPSTSEIAVKELQMLIMNGNPKGAEFTDDWKKIIR